MFSFIARPCIHGIGPIYVYMAEKAELSEKQWLDFRL